MGFMGAKLNLLVAWFSIVLGFASGFALGLNFHREDWLGGYSSHKRRLYRLGHISFFGLGTLNLLFYFTTRQLSLSSFPMQLAGWGFALGALSMPICCAIMAHCANWRALFLLPVSSLVAAGILTILEVIKI
jgi:hypothetical protein